MKQYPPSAVLLSFFVSALPLASCTDHGHARIAFASTAGMEESALAPPPAVAPPRATPTTDARIILVTIDGVRAEDVFDGADPSLRPGTRVDELAHPGAVMPRLHRLVTTRGVVLGADRSGCGSVRTASGANVSLPGYLEIFTGRKTTCRTNRCGRVETPTVLDQAALAGLAPVASIGAWEVLERAVSKGGTGVLVAEGAQPWPGPRPLAEGKMDALVADGEHAEPFPGVGHYRPDELTMPIALEYLRTAAPRVLHVGLGDADEWGHRNEYPSYLEAIGRSDAFIGKLAEQLSSMGEVGARTTVIVTTDHGRNRNFRDHDSYSFSAGRTFIAAFGAHVPVRGVACPTRDVSLADIAPTVRAILGLAPDASPDAGRPIEEILPARDQRVAGGAVRAGDSTGTAQLP